MPDLHREVRAALAEAESIYRDNPRAVAALRDQEARLRQPLRVALAGRRGAGKSTLVNALVGERVAPVTVADGGSVPAWYTDGQEPRATVRTVDGGSAQLPVSRHGAGPRVDLGGLRRAEVARVEVTWPARTLRELILVDVPVPDSAAEPDAGVRVTHRVAADADAVVYLARSPHGSDLAPLSACQAGRIASVIPVPVVLALAHADALSGGSLDALTASRRLARGYRRDERLRPLCQHVVAISAQLADAGRGLSDEEFTHLAALAAMPHTELETALLSADRFVGAALPVPLDTTTRQELLARFGVSGIRLATTLARQSCDSRAALAAELTKRSGLTELRESLGADLVARRDLLKARSALAALDGLLRTERPGDVRAARELSARLDRTLAGAHEFRELRLATALRGGAVSVPAGWREEAERLVGTAGEPVPARLALDERAGTPELVESLTGALARWRQRACDPLVTTSERSAAGTVATTCERMLADLAAG